LNWVLGHIVFYRGSMLKIIGLGPAFEGEPAVLYRRGSQPDGTEQYLDLATLRGLLSDAHQELIPALSALSVEELNRNVPQDPARPQPPSSIGNALARLSFHETYHAGQIGLLRRIVGKEGAIK
jgi:uncharacterized damage-inducible protein DinB